jgi:uncharacterized protein (TIGR03067 family)
MWHALFLASVLTLADAPKNDTIEDEMTGQGLASLHGAWKIRSLIEDGTKWDMELFRTHRFVIARDRLISKVDGKKSSEATIAIDDTRWPWRLVCRGNGQITVAAICRLDGDTLMICHTQEGSEFPQQFVSRRGSGLVLKVLQRQRK